MHLDLQLDLLLNWHLDQPCNLYLNLHANMHLDLVSNMHLNFPLDLHFNQSLHLQLFAHWNCIGSICFGYLCLQLYPHSFIWCLHLLNILSSSHMNLHLFKTKSGAWSPLYIQIACVLGIMGGHCMKLCYWHVTVSMPSLESIIHILLWTNDTQISSFLLISSDSTSGCD